MVLAAAAAEGIMLHGGQVVDSCFHQPYNAHAGYASSGASSSQAASKTCNLVDAASGASGGRHTSIDLDTVTERSPTDF